MDDNVYTLAFAAAIVFVVWKVIERKYIRKDTLVPKVLVSDALVFLLQFLQRVILVTISFRKHLRLLVFSLMSLTSEQGMKDHLCCEYVVYLASP